MVLAIPPRYVFVGGLHRSGTSLVARIIGTHPQVAAITGAPVPENEGVYLQGAIPHTARHGVPGHFATDPDQHLTEISRHNSLEVQRRLAADWAPWFAGDRPWRVEKSPVNLTRTRLYQQLFPLSQSVIVVRHPQTVAAAMAKWTDRPARDIVAHWVAAHRIVADDLPHLHAALVLRYEDLVAAPARTAAGLWAFLDLAPGPDPGPLRDGGADYSVTDGLDPETAAALAPWGYGPGGEVRPLAPQVRHPLRHVRKATEAALTRTG